MKEECCLEIDKISKKTNEREILFRENVNRRKRMKEEYYLEKEGICKKKTSEGGTLFREKTVIRENERNRRCLEKEGTCGANMHAKYIKEGEKKCFSQISVAGEIK